MKAQLFQATVSAFAEELTTESTFNWWTEPEKVRVSWYPFIEWKRKAYIFAKNRTKAVRIFAKHDPNVRDVCRMGRYELPACMAGKV